MAVSYLILVLNSAILDQRTVSGSGHFACCGPSLNLQLVRESWAGQVSSADDVTQSCDPPISAVTTCVIESFVYDHPESGFVLMTGKALLRD